MWQLIHRRWELEAGSTMTKTSSKCCCSASALRILLFNPPPTTLQGSWIHSLQQIFVTGTRKLSLFGFSFQQNGSSHIREQMWCNISTTIHHLPWKHSRYSSRCPVGFTWMILTGKLLVDAANTAEAKVWSFLSRNSAKRMDKKSWISNNLLFFSPKLL